MMDQVSSAISNEQMISVNVDPSNFVRIIKQMNVKMKEQDLRIHVLESSLSNYITKKEYADENVVTNAKINDAVSKTEKSLEDVKAFKTDVEKKIKSLEENVSNKFNDILLSTDANTKRSFDTLSERFDLFQQTQTNFQKAISDQQVLTHHHQDDLKEQKALISRLNEIMQKYQNDQKAVQATPQPAAAQSSQQHSTANRQVLPEELRALNDKFNRLEQRVNLAQELDSEAAKKYERAFETLTKQMTDRFNSLQNSIQKAFAPPPTDPQRDKSTTTSQFNELWSISNQNRATLVTALNDQTVLAKRVDELNALVDSMRRCPTKEEMAPPEEKPKQITESPTSLEESVKEDVPHEFEQLLHTTKSSVDDLNMKIGESFQEISKLKNCVNRNEKDVRDVVLAIVDEFKLIRGKASGLEDLPPLNLATCVPSFFNNPSFTYARQESSDPSSRDTGGSVSVSHSAEHIPTISTPESKKKSPPPETISEESSFLQNDDLPDPPADVKKEKSKPRVAIVQVLKKENSTPHTEEPPPQQVIQRVEIVRRVEEDDKALKEMMDHLHGDSENLHSALERKVDRDMVERLFNKFRSIVLGLNNRVVEMAAMMKDFATKQDIDTIADFVSHPPENAGTSAGIKKGTSCLLCGRARNSVTGQLSGDQNMVNAGATIRTASGGEDGGFIIGDGGAFKSSRFESFPRLPLLNPVKVPKEKGTNLTIG